MIEVTSEGCEQIASKCSLFNAFARHYYHNVSNCMIWLESPSPELSYSTLFITVNNNFGCGQPTRFTAPNGTIYSHLGYNVGHHYGKNIRCIWTIEAPAGWFVELVAEGFEIESYS